MGMHGGLRRILELDESRAHDQRATAARLAGYLKPFTSYVILILVLVILNSAAFALAPFLIGRAIDQFIAAGDRTGLGYTVLLLLGAYVLGLATMSGQFYLMGWIGQTVLARIVAKQRDVPEPFLRAVEEASAASPPEGGIRRILRAVLRR